MVVLDGAEGERCRTPWPDEDEGRRCLDEDEEAIHTPRAHSVTVGPVTRTHRVDWLCVLGIRGHTLPGGSGG